LVWRGWQFKIKFLDLECWSLEDIYLSILNYKSCIGNKLSSSNYKRNLTSKIHLYLFPSPIAYILSSIITSHETHGQTPNDVNEKMSMVTQLDEKGGTYGRWPMPHILQFHVYLLVILSFSMTFAKSFCNFQKNTNREFEHVIMTPI
jgi:hypothetical protein